VVSDQLEVLVDELLPLDLAHVADGVTEILEREGEVHDRVRVRIVVDVGSGPGTLAVDLVVELTLFGVVL
jgi:hypothetical protein